MALSLLCLSPSSLAFLPPLSTSSSSRRVSSSLAVSSSTPTPTPELPAVEFIDPLTGCEVVLLGCFHGTESSSQDVRQAVTSDTDVVVLELCAARFADMRRGIEEEAAAKNNSNAASKKKPWIVAYLMMIQQTMQQKGMATGLAVAVLGGISGMQTALSGFSPGLEFITALECAQQFECDVVLADQEVDETLREVGRLPQISWEMLTNTDTVFEEYKLHSTTLRRAVFGPDGSGDATTTSTASNSFNPVQLGQALVRSAAAVQDLVRLTMPPTFLYYCLLQMVLAGSPGMTAATDVDSSMYYYAAASSSSMAELIPHWIASVCILSMGYLGVALPAVRVILTDRDVCLTEGIQQACQRAGANGRVVAVLGLLHVNGVATRMMNAHQVEEEE
jgi:pheromone shutdown protein TraB